MKTVEQCSEGLVDSAAVASTIAFIKSHYRAPKQHFVLDRMYMGDGGLRLG